MPSCVSKFLAVKDLPTILIFLFHFKTRFSKNSSFTSLYKITYTHFFIITMLLLPLLPSYPELPHFNFKGTVSRDGG
jgi:hypothetical protein